MGTRASSPTYVRAAHHAGSWYSDSAAALDEQLTRFLSTAAAEAPSAQDPSTTRLRALICPHAGYSYSGPTAAYAYHALLQELASPHSPVRTILVLHPSHHVSLENQCAVSMASTLRTPLGDLEVDAALRREILARSDTTQPPWVTTLRQSVDEAEHSGEMQYPLLAKVIQQATAQRKDITPTERMEQIQVLPIMVGQLSEATQRRVGGQLADIVAQPHVLTVVSTDFCHWGARFHYTPMPDDRDERHGQTRTSSRSSSIPIHQFIEQLDRRGMTLIELQQPGAFAEYLRETRNTICGRNAVAVWMQAAVADPSTSRWTDSSTDQEDTSAGGLQIKFVKYAQSSAVKSAFDSSVSYAAAVAYATNE